MQARNAQKVPDWSAISLDDEGRQIQEEMTAKFQVWQTQKIPRSD